MTGGNGTRNTAKSFRTSGLVHVEDSLEGREQRDEMMSAISKREPPLLNHLLENRPTEDGCGLVHAAVQTSPICVKTMA